MKLATVLTTEGTHAVEVTARGLEVLDAPDVGTVLTTGLETVTRTGEVLDQARWAPLVPRPSKVWCVGMNYRKHIAELGGEVPTHPTLFTKFANSLCGATDEIWLPPESEKVDWEVELTIVIGRRVRRASVQEAEEAIAGFSVANDVSMRDWQNRTNLWDQGKAWEHATPVGPWMVTPDELTGGVRPDLAIECEVNRQLMQSSRTSDMVFDPVTLVQYISTIATLEPGDLVLTGTPGGVGMARKPPVFLAEGDEVVTRIEALGECRNRCVVDPTA